MSITSKTIATGIFLATLIVSPVVWAADYTVDTTTDEVDGSCSDGDCSLRDAIILSNADTTRDTIRFDDTISGSAICLTLSGTGEDSAATGDLDIRQPLWIIGNGATSTIIDGGSTEASGTTTCTSSLGDRIFHINSASASDDVNISSLTIAGGDITESVGGGIYNQKGDASVSFSVIKNNRVYFTNSSNGHGGGISNSGPSASMSLSECRVIDNLSYAAGTRKAYAGGLYNSGALTLNYSEVSGNTAQGNTATGGGVVASSSTSSLSIMNSTIANNTASTTASSSSVLYGGGLAVLNSSTVTLNNITLAENTAATGGGIYLKSGTVSIKNSLIAENTATGSGTDCYTYSSYVLASYGYNLIETLSGCTLDYTASSADSATDLTNQTALIGALSDNGGSTYTMVPETSSPAIDAGACTDINGDTIFTDQRMNSRDEDVCEIGAYEILCSDSNTDATEECDDGNTTDHDGCSATCMNETLYYTDSDVDGYGVTTYYSATDPGAGYAALGDDCNDLDAAIHPTAAETCGDGIDSDCNDDTETFTLYIDADGDGYGSTSGTAFSCDESSTQSGYLDTSNDCNDSDATVNPVAVETCGDSIDQDCTGADLSCVETTTETSTETTTETSTESESSTSTDTDSDTATDSDTGSDTSTDTATDESSSASSSQNPAIGGSGCGCQLKGNVSAQANTLAWAMILVPAGMILGLRRKKSTA